MRIPTIEQLRKSGYKARVTVLRLTSEHSDYVNLRDIRGMFEEGDGTVDNATLNSFLRPKGGKVIVEVRTPEGVELRGEAICAATENFSKKYGRTLALVRALGLKPEPKYKVGDEVWCLRWVHEKSGQRIRKSKIEEVRKYSDRFKISDDLTKIELCYGFSYRFGEEDTDTEYTIEEDSTFPTKEELITYLES